MRRHKSKFGVGLILFILVVVFLLIFNKTRSEKYQAQKTASSPQASVTEYFNEDEYLASSSNLNSPLPKPASLEEYTYPNAASLSASSNQLKFETSDSAQVVTDWYKNKINSLNFNAKSVTQSNVNGEVLNKITAAKPGENLEVTIKKDQTTSKVEITVDRS